MIDEISHIVEQLVMDMDCTISGEYNALSGNTDYCKTKWARKGKQITIPGELFLIDSIDYNKFITPIYLGSTIPAPELDGITTLPKPFFISGTKLATNREWTIAGNDVMAKTPIIWLLETIREREFGRGSSIKREVELRLFFLDETNIVDFYTEDHRREVVYPMQQLVAEFIRTVEADRRFKTLEDYTMKTFSRFGVEKDNGVFQNVLDANLSGVELIITLTQYKENCKC
jgi:hypothetical protein